MNTKIRPTGPRVDDGPETGVHAGRNPDAHQFIGCGQHVYSFPSAAGISEAGSVTEQCFEAFIL